MSGLRGTIGSPERDPIAAWIYDHLDGLEPNQTKSVFRLVQNMVKDKNHLLKIEDKSFRQRMAKLVRAEYLNQIREGFTALDSSLASRLNNLVARNYRQAIGAGQNASICGWCKNPISMSQPFKIRNGGKMHYKCVTAFDKAGSNLNHE